MDRPVPAAEVLPASRPRTMAIWEMAGQGGGVRPAGMWRLAEAQGFVAQSTSVPGVAQRTGATIYYVEMLPPRDGVAPILSLMPTPGDVDVVIAAEMMEAGRSILRGLVTPDKTVMIASTHRSFAVSEKAAPGDGIGDPLAVIDAAEFAAKRTIAFDMEALALENGSVISAALFGALAATGVLPFDRTAFAATIRAGGRGAEASLRAFDAAYARAREKPRDAVVAAPRKRLDALPDFAGHPSLDRLGALLASARVHDGEAHGFAFTIAAAKYVAVAMAYDDVIRVADLKVRRARFARVRSEVGAKADQIVYTTEYMHPRMDEVCGTLPKRLGEWIEDRPKLFAWLDRLVNRGRRVRTGTVLWFIALYLVSALRGQRRGTLRHHRERIHREAWLASATAVLSSNYDLAVAALECRRLVKG